MDWLLFSARSVKDHSEKMHELHPSVHSWVRPRSVGYQKTEIVWFVEFRGSPGKQRIVWRVTGMGMAWGCGYPVERLRQ